MGRSDSRSPPARGRGSPRRRSPSRREISPPPRKRSSHAAIAEKSSSRNRSPRRIKSRSPISLSPGRGRPPRSPKRRKSISPASQSPIREKPSSRTKSPKQTKSRSPKSSGRARSPGPTKMQSRSPSPRTKRLRRAERETEEKLSREREPGKNHGRSSDRQSRSPSPRTKRLRRAERETEEKLSSRSKNSNRIEQSERRERKSGKDAIDDGSSKLRNGRRSASPSERHHKTRHRSRSPAGEHRNGDNDDLSKMKEAEEALEAKNKDKPSFELSGKLAAETNRVRGITLLFNEPPDARKPDIRWRLYVFKGGDVLNEPLYVHRQSCYLFGRERRVADIPTDHPSCSKQHAVLQYRSIMSLRKENPQKRPRDEDSPSGSEYEPSYEPSIESNMPLAGIPKRRKQAQPPTTRHLVDQLSDSTPSQRQTDEDDEESSSSQTVQVEPRRKQMHDTGATSPTEAHATDDTIWSGRFVSEEAYHRFQESFAKRSIIAERGLVTQQMNKFCKNFLNQLKNRNWQCFINKPRKYNETLVREFYANAGETKDKTPHKCRVRSRLVRYDPRTINRFLGLGHHTPEAYWHHLSLANLAREWVASTIGVPSSTPPAWTLPDQPIYKKYLNFEAKSWLAFVCSRLQSSRNDNYVRLTRAVLLAAIMRGLPINVGLLIAGHIDLIAPQPRSNLGFPSLLTGLMEEAGVPVDPNDVIREPGLDFDIFDSLDADNPAKQKHDASTSAGQSEEPESAPATTSTVPPSDGDMPPPSSIEPSISILPPQATRGVRGILRLVQSLFTWVKSVDARLVQLVAAVADRPSTSSAPPQPQPPSITPADLERITSAIDRMSDRLTTAIESQARSISDLFDRVTSLEKKTSKLAAEATLKKYHKKVTRFNFF